MKKLALNVESLKVESFETAEGIRDRGTVHARSDSSPHVCYSFGDPCTAAAHCTTGCGPDGSRVWEHCNTVHDDWETVGTI